MKGQPESLLFMEELKQKRGMIQPSQQYLAPCIKVVEWGLGTRGLRVLKVRVINKLLILLMQAMSF